MAQILIIEENPDRTESLQLMLEFAAHDVQVVANGKQALAYLEADNAPDIILSKLITPEIDGMLLCRTVRQNKSWADIPVILIAEADHSPMVDKLAKRAGATALIRRPLQRDAFLAEIDRAAMLASVQENPFSRPNPMEEVLFLRDYNTWLAEQLYSATYELTRTTAQRDLGHAHVETIHSFSKVLGENLNLSESIQRMVIKIGELLRAQMVAVFVRDMDKNFALGHIAGFGIPTPKIKMAFSPETLQPVWDNEDDQRALLLDTQTQVEQVQALFEIDVEMHSFLLSPLTARGENIGFISMGRTDADDLFTYQDAETIFSIAGVGGLAVRSAQLFHELEEAYEDLQKLDQRRREFVAITSHELRTPLAIMLGYASLLHDIEEDPIKREQIGTIEKQASFLSGMVDALLNLHELNEPNASVSLRCRYVQIDALLRDALQATRTHNIYDKSVGFEIDSDTVTILGDEIRLMLVFNNLMDNAIKFSSDGDTVKVTAAARPEGGVVVTVEDKGIGIPPEHIDQIFDPFYQVEPAITRSYGGMGLGLAIVKGVIDLHDGEIEVRSKVDEGTRFIITLNAEPPANRCRGTF